jgi:poly(3-hydroxybutyrate) depolymerase
MNAKLITLSLISGFLAACSPPSYTLAHNPTPYERDLPTLYYLYLPASYTPDRDWPLFVGIHGAGGDGSNCLVMWQQYADPEGFVLLCPSLSDESGGWYQDDGEKMVKRVLKEVRAEVRVQKRFFLAGYSAGAQFVQGYAFANPKDVTGAAVLSAGNYYEPDPHASAIPFLVILGEKDNPTGLKNAGDFIDLLRKEGFSVDLQILPGVGHHLNDQAFDLAIEFYRRVYGK